MFLYFCLFILLPFCVFGQADVSTPSVSFTFPTDQPIWEVTPVQTLPPTTKGSANDVTELYVPNDTTFQPAPDRSDTTPVAPTAPPTPPPTDSASSTSPQTTNATTESPAPQTTNATTESPAPQTTNATNVTTAAPHTTNVTTAAPPTPTTPPPPEVGDYIVRAGPNSSACLMAKMGLQLSYRMGASFQTTNLNPNGTMTTGTCGDASNDSTLVLVSDKIAVQFIFTNQTSKFFLSALSLTVVTGSGPNFTAANTNLSLWEASLGSSYMCKKEQSFNITDDFILNTFELQVQPFGVTNDQFSTAHECSVDDTSLLIPIIVGAALAVLILIVVIAYVIGRRKTYVGYQTL